ncbi:MAG: PAS domain S-box protein [Desulfovibrionaceae bacterium]
MTTNNKALQQKLEAELARLPDEQAKKLLGIIAEIQASTAQQVEGQERIQSLFYSMAGDVILMHDMQGTILEVNQLGSVKLGYEPAELVGKSVSDLVSVHSEERFQAIMDRVQHRGAYSFESVFRTRDGRDLPMDVSARTVVHDGQEAILSIARDITARKVAEEIILEQKTFLSHIIKNLPVGVFVKKVRNDFRYTLWNSKIGEMTGRSREQVIGKTDREVFGEGGWIWRSESDWKALDKGEAVDLCVEERNADGERVIFHVIKVPLFDNAGEPDSILGIIEDITDRVRAEAEIRKAHDELEQRVKARTAELLGVNERLKAAEEKYRSIFDNSVLGIFRSNLEGALLVGNPALAKMLGYRNMEDLMLQTRGRPERIHASLDRLRAVLQGLLAGEEFKPVEMEFLRADGTSLLGRTHVRLLHDRRDNYPYLEGFVEDVSERATFQRKLEQSERDYRVLYEQASEAIFVLDMRGRIIDANSMASEILGYKPSELLQTDPRTLIHSNVEATRKVLSQVKDGRTLRTELELTTRSGRPITCDLSARLLGNDRVLALVRDTTERKAMEEELRRAKEEAEQASQAKSEFLANMSHEIRTPLGGIIGLTDMVLNSQLPEGQAEYLRGIREASGSLLEIINDILDFSKIEARKMKIFSEPFRLRDRLGIVLSTFRLGAKERGLELRSVVDPAVPDCLVGDPCRVGQVLSNLISNAIKFTDKGSVEMVVRALNVTSDAARIEFSVTDTGIGIAREDQNKLFEVFFQLEPALSKTHRGTGLGLAISKRLVEMMGGDMSLESVKGEGSRFSFVLELPVADKDADSESSVPGPEENDQSMPGRRVLLAEDNELNQEFLTFFLEEANHQVRVAGNGLEVLKALDEEEFDIVLMDIQMPEMDGMEATRLIRKGRTKASTQIPIVALTAYAMKGDRERMLEAGMDDYLSKPVEMDQLLAIIARLTGQGE